MEQEHQREQNRILKVVLFGPESTGKSTLAQQLAEHYNTVFVPEYSRLYAEMKLLCGKELTQDDVIEIAEGQLKLEIERMTKANKILFCDTDLLETKVYSELYYEGYCPPQLEDFAQQKTADLYLLTDVDVPWVADNVRDKPENRKEHFNIFEKTLQTYNKPYQLIRGDESERFHNAVKYVEELIKENK